MVHRGGQTGTPGQPGTCNRSASDRSKGTPRHQQNTAGSSKRKQPLKHDKLEHHQETTKTPLQHAMKNTAGTAGHYQNTRDATADEKTHPKTEAAIGEQT